ncbi:oxygen-independent coproporphyrinogen III oxidase [Billgrantia lactosivorans]|uniref:oxygen-independent coproporphyrinogen III oxidase n=1 Tax=Billgrantia lactosivorans TaxID=2185141 RepID=UPI001FECE407|nr:oxygen-independent coproporphyrinogen III oxidase [Halomonas lactosivorans]
MSVPAMSVHRAMADPFAWDEALLRRYDSHGPRYASYPTARSLRDDFGTPAYQDALARSNADGRPLSLYVHIPFCRKSCHYCACHKIATKATRVAEPYLSRLDREMVLIKRHLDTRREVAQLHWGGGTPTFLSLDQMSDLIDRLDARFGLSSARDRDYAIEIDPREADVFTLRHLQALGFNRLSLGVQDLDPRVQRAVNRIQPRILTEALLDEADRLGFRSLNIDLIYGLPLQTRDSFAATLEQVIAMAPARLSIFNYAHLPERFAAQRRIRADDLPGPEEKLAILRTTIAMLTEAGYVHIGMDHFARASDSLALAQREGTLQRNFQGYSSHAQCDLVGLGVSAISCLDDVYAQNHTSLAAYEAALDSSQLPTARGLRLTFDDRVRRHAIERLMCDMTLDLDELSETFGIEAPRYLADALSRLEALQRDGLVSVEGHRVVATPIGRLLIRHIAMAFDARLPPQPGPQFSRIV